MKMIPVATGVTIAFLMTGPVFASTALNPGFEKWQSDHAKTLCADHETQFKDAVSARGIYSIPTSAEKTANLGEAQCLSGNYVKGDQQLSKALAKLDLTPSAGEIEDVD